MLKQLGHKWLNRLRLDSAIARNSIFLLSAEFIRTGVNFFLSALLGRYLQPEGLGALKFIVNFSILFAVLTDAGISRVSVRSMARAPLSEHDKLHGTLLAARLFLSFVSFVILVGSLSLVPTTQLRSDMRFLIALYMWSQIFQAFRKNPEVIWQARQQLHYHAFFAITNRVFMVIGIVLAVLNRAPLWVIIATYVAVDFLDCAVANWYVYRYFSKPQWPHSWHTVISLVREAVPFGLQNLAQQLRYYFDVVLLKFLFQSSGATSDRQIGLYASATPFVLSLQFIPTSFAGAVYPELARTYTADRVRFNRLTSATLLILSSIGTSLALVIYFGRTFLISLTYGKGFSEAIPLLGIIAWLVPFVFLSTGLLVIFAAAERQNILTATNWITLIGKFMLCLLLIPGYAAKGAAFASIAAEAANTLILLAILASSLPQAFPLRGLAALIICQFCYYLVCVYAQPMPFALGILVLVQLVLGTIGPYLGYRALRDETKWSC